MKRRFISIILIFFLSHNIFSFDLQNYLSSSFQYSNSANSKYGLNLKYQPSLDIDILRKEKFYLDSSATWSFDNQFKDYNDKIEYNPSILPYRYWFRISSNQSEIRLGLQKLNFGPAQILRSLRWFDTTDPKDPRKATDGVYAVLARHYFLNNSNIWFWSILNNSNLKGNEILRSKNNSIEYGGRAQTPLQNGEIAFSYHYRKLESDINPIFEKAFKKNREDRFALDFSYDYFIGIYNEISISKYYFEEDLPDLQKNITIGGDYTFPIANGFHLVYEQMFVSIGDNLFSNDYETKISALSIDYPIGLFDQCIYILNYLWDKQIESGQKFQHFISYQRSYDKLSIFLNVFYTPEENNIEIINQKFASESNIQLVIDYHW